MIRSLRMSAGRLAGISSMFHSFQLPNCWRSDIKNFDDWVSFPKAKPSPPQLAPDVMFGTWGKSAADCWLSAVAAVTTMQARIVASYFSYDRDTLAYPHAIDLKSM